MNDEGPQHTKSELEIIEVLIDEHVRVNCNLIQIDAQTWAIHGTIAVDGEVILAEFSNKDDAETALELLSAAEEQVVSSSRRSQFS
jgi:hypothetical protein